METYYNLADEELAQSGVSCGVRVLALQELVTPIVEYFNLDDFDVNLPVEEDTVEAQVAFALAHLTNAVVLDKAGEI